MKEKNKKGFTLIELLVVIAVIALLLSIIIPTINKAKDYAKRTICSSNARQTGIALKVYAQSNDDWLIPMTDEDGNGNQMPWEAVIAYSPNHTISAGVYKPLNLAVLYALDMITDPEVFYCPAQPRISEYPNPYYYDYYTNKGKAEWGTYMPLPIPPATWSFVRTSFNYWTYDKKRFSELHATKPIVVDNLQEWEVIPHRKNRLSVCDAATQTPNVNNVPQGVTALFADGHANFCIGDDIFDDAIWPQQTGWMNGPGDRKDAFLKILRVIEGHQ